MTVAGVLFLGVCYMAFIFPRTLAAWHEQGVELSVAQLLLAKIASLCQNVGLFVLPLLAILVLVSLVLVVLPVRGSGNEVLTKQ